ncbi:MAG: glycine betaine/carnitine/choline transporter permease protein [Symbiobacteriaceae bacterium]|jgi:osmoprotectant transport system permease protein|nr:glycine betaine/carnitine/choline transporter permease protein [Symbiobacteriaceae bacterium]
MQNGDRVFGLTLEHLQLALVGVCYALLVGVPIGILISRYKWLVDPMLWLANAIQTVPALALMGFVMLLTGLTRSTGIIVLFLYSLMPIIRSTYTGITGVDPATIEAARGMGMTRWQILCMVQVPLAVSVILVGFRVAMVIGIGTASIMSLAGAGGLGQLIFAGIDRVQDKMILAGALPAVLLAVAAELGIGALEKRLIPRGLR